MALVERMLCCLSVDETWQSFVAEFWIEHPGEPSVDAIDLLSNSSRDMHNQMVDPVVDSLIDSEWRSLAAQTLFPNWAPSQTTQTGHMTTRTKFGFVFLLFSLLLNMTMIMIHDIAHTD